MVLPLPRLPLQKQFSIHDLRAMLHALAHCFEQVPAFSTERNLWSLRYR
jgi:hypothetical protein